MTPTRPERRVADGRSRARGHLVHHWRRLSLGTAVLVAAVTATPMTALGATSVPNAITFRGTSTVGALFTLNKNGSLGSHFCTGSVISGPTADLVMTAAHCVSGRTIQSMAFVPEYADGRAPYGVWPVTRVVLTKAWSTSADPDDDVALIVVKAPSANVRSLSSLTGANQITTAKTANVMVHVIGYPDTSAAPITCANVATSYSATQLRFDCDGYTMGTSGGPLLASVGSSGAITVIGVIGGYEEGGLTPSVSYAAKFGANVSTLLAAVTG